jgi:hypothetical protein
VYSDIKINVQLIVRQVLRIDRSDIRRDRYRSASDHVDPVSSTRNRHRDLEQRDRRPVYQLLTSQV